MSLGDDMRAMQWHKDNGTLAEFMAGTLTLAQMSTATPEPSPREQAHDASKGTPIWWREADKKRRADKRNTTEGPKA